MSTFKTPRKGTTPYKSASIYKSSSDDNISDSGDSGLNIVAEFDNICRCNNAIKTDYMNMCQWISNFVEEGQQMYNSLKIAREEILRLQVKLEAAQNEKNDLDYKLGTARKLLDQERKHAKSAAKERDCLLHQLSQIKYLMEKEENKKISNDAWGRIKNISARPLLVDESAPFLSAIPEVNSTGSILSDLSYSKSENDLDVSEESGKTWKKHRPSTEPEPPQKKRRSSNKFVEINHNDTVRATTTLTVSKHGPITATSIIESVPKSTVPDETCAPSAPPTNQVFQQYAEENLNKNPGYSNTVESKTISHYQRQHNFLQKFVVIPLDCIHCKNKVRFGKVILKCKECKSVCHPECKDKLTMPCIPGQNTPNHGVTGFISDFTGVYPPFIPALVMRCVNEIESRGLDELGLYRVPGSEKDVKLLKDRMLKSKTPVVLSDVDIPVLCGVLKDFLRGLREPLIPSSHRANFIKALRSESNELPGVINRAFKDLPKANQDTLSFLIRHMQKIANSPACKMPIANLAKVFGPTIVAYTETAQLSRNDLMTETHEAIQLMEALMLLPSGYWESFFATNHTPRGRLEQTISTDSLLLRAVATPGRDTPRKKRFFPTPPRMKL